METAQITAIDERKALLAEATGDEAEQINLVRLDIEKMKMLGVLIDIDIHGTSMFTARATWAELGIPEQDIRRKRLKRGSKSLLPPLYDGRIRSLETRFRQSLERHSFILQGFRPWRWNPFTAYPAWRQEWDKLQAELVGLRMELIEHRAEFVAAVVTDWTKIASEAWQSIKARRPKGAGDFVLITPTAVFETLEAFTEHVISQVVAQFPTAEEIETGLYVEYRNAMVVTGADLDAERLRQEQLTTEREQERAKQHAVQAKAQAQQRLLDIETREADQLSHLRLQEERIKLAAMREAELEHARQQIQNTVSPFAEVISQFRARIASDVAEIATSVKKNGHVRGKVAERARGLLDLYRLLGAAAGDDELETSLLELRHQLAQRPADEKAGRYDTDAVLTALNDVADLTHDAAKGIIHTLGAHTRAGALEL
jgi:hypothetical protein